MPGDKAKKRIFHRSMAVRFIGAIVLLLMLFVLVITIESISGYLRKKLS